jgi:hypothetical protein
MHSQRELKIESMRAYLSVEPISDENVNFGVLGECGAAGGTSLVRHVEQTAGAEGVPTCDGYGLVEYIYSRVRTSGGNHSAVEMVHVPRQMAHWAARIFSWRSASMIVVEALL